ncbi:MAG: hypothetical protein JO218_08440 [Burkholderiales bacterium]|nr:hypothetical protein [Burkholderiales bacterium]
MNIATRYLAALLVSLAATAVLADKASSVHFDFSFQLPTIQKLYPDHYTKITLILDQISAMPEGDVPNWIVHSFGASDVIYQPTQAAGKSQRHRLAFTLDGIRYDSYVTVNSYDSHKVMPRY